MSEMTELDRIRQLANLPAKEPAKKPGGWAIVLINDPEVNGNMVIRAFEDVLRITREEAKNIIMKAHRFGLAAAKTYSNKDIAETKAQQIRDHVKNNQDPDIIGNPALNNPRVSDQRQRQVTIEVREVGDK